MIGRASLRQPWIFSQTATLLRTGTVPPDLTRAEKLRVVREHLDLLLEHLGEAEAVQCLTQRISLYGRTLGHVKPMKEAIRLARSAKEIRATLDEWITGAEERALVS
jgi:tRNA-dihydrouridine synthase